MDGAMGTQLIDRGLKKGDCPDFWCIEKPDIVREIHKSYFDAGADVVTTNTFGSTPAKLKEFSLEDRVVEINKKAVELAKSVCPEGKYVAGDMGPTGLFLPPVGNATLGEIRRSYEVQAKALAEAGADLLIIETQYDLREAIEALKAAKSTSLPVFVTMTFGKKRRGFFTIMGNTPEESFKALQSAGADVVGANCTLSSSDFVDLTYILRKSTSLPLLVQPNAGQPKIDGDRIVYDETPRTFAENMKKMIDAGVNLVGSCCGSTPAFTKELALLLNSKV